MPSPDTAGRDGHANRFHHGRQLLGALTAGSDPWEHPIFARTPSTSLPVLIHDHIWQNALFLYYVCHRPLRRHAMYDTCMLYPNPTYPRART